jgi:hypothetical protein
MKNFAIPVLVKAPGGFLVYGIVIAVMNKLTEKKGGVKRKSFSCEGCPSAGMCDRSTCAESSDSISKEIEDTDVKEGAENA